MTIFGHNSSGPGAMLGDLPVTSRYSFGLGGERFFRAIKDEGRILGSRCPECDMVYVPGVIFCERCLAGIEEWVDVGTVGEVHTFTVLNIGYDGSLLEVPEMVAYIRLGDGGLVHRISGIDPEDMEIGMTVQAVFKPEDERVGSITDILHFTKS
jgi:uncharacterized OB-fold protein